MSYDVNKTTRQHKQNQIPKPNINYKKSKYTLKTLNRVGLPN